jgi:hypothetical protein
MKRLEFACDGCDLVEHVALPAEGAANFMIEGWVAYHSVVRENDGEPYEISADLCPRCVVKMRHAINPANWPHAIKSVPKDQARRAVI